MLKIKYVLGTVFGFLGILLLILFLIFNNEEPDKEPVKQLTPPRIEKRIDLGSYDQPQIKKRIEFDQQLAIKPEEKFNTMLQSNEQLTEQWEYVILLYNVKSVPSGQIRLSNYDKPNDESGFIIELTIIVPVRESTDKVILKEAIKYNANFVVLRDMNKIYMEMK